MEKRLLCVVFILIFMVSLDSAQPNQRVGKRTFKAIIQNREYCARARQICSPAEDDDVLDHDDADVPDLYP
ncbi:hypothetical protein P5673_024785 [Acropora cervicornis]|uniref:Uncharacterized protein n=1 Tax=Acropora cervicornis TaxID=6130 RepID=A0AAD9UXP7_ACRCE|nr:hypothetical protein P5673_024785 [Acropora cervicornis]